MVFRRQNVTCGTKIGRTKRTASGLEGNSSIKKVSMWFRQNSLSVFRESELHFARFMNYLWTKCLCEGSALRGAKRYYARYVRGEMLKLHVIYAMISSIAAGKWRLVAPSDANIAVRCCSTFRLNFPVMHCSNWSLNEIEHTYCERSLCLDCT
jgi:hypothetical protein